MKFDYIIGNPPYNGPKPKEGSLYAVIVSKALKRLKPNGQSIMIHPSGWRFNEKGSKILSDLYFSNTTEAELHNVLFSRYIWNVVANVDVVKVTMNNKPSVKVKFEELIPKDEKEQVDVTEWCKKYPIPTMYFDIFKEIIEYSEGKEKIQLVKPPKIDTQENKDDFYKYPAYFKIMKPKRIHEGIIYTNNKPDNRPKIIMSWGSLHNLLDLNGEYQGTRERNYYIYGTKEQLIKLYEVIDSLKFKLFFQSVSGSDQRVIYDQYGKKLLFLQMLSFDFGDKFFEITKEYDNDYFYHSVLEIKKSGVYKDYVQHAKIGATWNENKKKERK
jgi:hypothetical protein